MKYRKQSSEKIQVKHSSSSSIFPQIIKKRSEISRTSKDTKRRSIMIQKESNEIIQLKLSQKQTKKMKNEDIKIPKEQQKLKVSAKSYGVYDQDLDPLIQYNSSQKRQIASLTKMMTLLASLKLTEKYGVNIKNTYFRASANASNILGTLAEIDPKQWATVQDLLYGLMLPSGNDAAQILAQNFGAYLYYQKQGEIKALKQIKSLDITNDSMNIKLYVQNFVKFMNQIAKQSQMIDTIFMNPHGLDCKESFSTVKDVSKLLRAVMNNQIGSKIICTRNYFARLKNSIGKKETNYREIDWMNTNKLMWKKGYRGGKTGQTIGAGNCLATVYEHEGGIYYIIVLGCSRKQDRFVETQKLVEKYIIKIE